MAWLTGFLLQIVKWALPLIVHDLYAWVQDYLTKRAQEKQDTKTSSDYEKIVHDPNASREERKNAEDSSFN